MPLSLPLSLSLSLSLCGTEPGDIHHWFHPSGDKGRNKEIQSQSPRCPGGESIRMKTSPRWKHQHENKSTSHRLFFHCYSQHTAWHETWSSVWIVPLYISTWLPPSLGIHTNTQTQTHTHKHTHTHTHAHICTHKLIKHGKGVVGFFN